MPTKFQSHLTTDHDLIRRWAEDRHARPARVKAEGNENDPDLLRLDFPGYNGEDRLEQISWEEFFESFEVEKLAFVYQDHTAGGKKSNFNKLVSRVQLKRTK